MKPPAIRDLVALLSCAIICSSAIAEPPRLGLEIELAAYNDAGPILNWNHLPRREDRVATILKFWQKVLPDTKFRIDKEWVSESRKVDGFELVSPPLTPDQIKIFAEHFDQFQKESQVGPGLKASLQFNIELRNLIPGFSLTEQPTDKMGVSFREIQKANISGVVKLLLFLENYSVQIYAVQKPQRMGMLMSHFAIPMSLEQPDLLRELRDMPPENQTYEAVRQVFLNYHQKEMTLAIYGDRSPWKYRSFNINKFFNLNANPDWVYPALEIRIPDSPSTGEELSRQLEFVYALIEASQKFDVKNWTPPTEMAEFLKKNRDKMSFRTMLNLLNQHIVDWIATEEGKESYVNFMNVIGKKSPKDRSIAREQPAYASQTYLALKPLMTSSQTRHSLPATFGAEFEYANPALDANMVSYPFLEQKISTELTGNHEVRTHPTSDLNQLFSQIGTLREAFGEDLRSIHVHTRISKKTIEEIGLLHMNAWLGDISDWIVALRAIYRRPEFAFNARTQQRMKIESPNGWIANDKREYRGTVRAFEVDDFLDIEIRGLMTGIYKTGALPTEDYLRIALEVLLTGIENPYLIPKKTVNRLASEFTASPHSFTEEVMAHAQKRNWQTSQLLLQPSMLLQALVDPARMLLPLQGLEFNPRLSAQDVQRLKNARLYWLDEVVAILTQHSSLESAKAPFLESLQNWARRADLAKILFDTLLIMPKGTLSWDQQNLPLPPLRLAWMKKLVALQSGSNARVEFGDHLANWFRHSRAGFKVEAKQLSETEKNALLDTLKNQLAPVELADLHKALGLPALAKAVAEKSNFKTNLQVLLDPGAEPAPEEKKVPTPPPPLSNPQEALAKEVLIYRSKDNAEKWATEALRKLEPLNASTKLEALRFISQAAAESSRCINCESQYIWVSITALYRKAELSRKALAWVAEPWISYAIRHSRKAMNDGRPDHGREGLRAFHSIFSRESVQRHPDLVYFYDRWHMSAPPIRRAMRECPDRFLI